ncbi:MAG: hypothetical protein IPP38_12465 [Bacteroidetes bacterium]|nr:hypothetical protein [Bacteroidota bacterium]
MHKKVVREQILRYYKSTDFGYELKLMPWSKKAKSYEMNYRTTINATTRAIRVKVVMEKDTCRLFLDISVFKQKNNYFDDKDSIGIIY